MRFLSNVRVEALGESRKVSDEYTIYDYIEFVVDGRLEQVKQIYVHDTVNAGLVSGMTGEFIVGSLCEHSCVTTPRYITELFASKTQTVERTNFDPIVEELQRKPTLLGLIPWIFGLPIRVWNAGKYQTNVLGLLIFIFWAIIAAPFVAPFTYFNRYKRYRSLVKETKNLVNSLVKYESGLHLDSQLKKLVGINL